MPWLIICPAAVILAAAIAYLVLLWPAARKHPDRKVMEGRYIAHRGLHNAAEGVPENSLPAFERACGAGLIIENDIHLTKDGQVVVFHDDDLSRMCGDGRSPEDLTLKEIRELRLLGTEHGIPTLSECLGTVAGRVPLLIEFKLKNGNGEALCLAADRILSEYGGKYMIQSFYPQVPRWYRRNRPEIMRGQLATVIKGQGAAKRLLGTLVENVASRPDFVSFDREHKNYFPRKLAVLLGAFPAGWTFRSAEEIKADRRDFKAYIFENITPEELPKNDDDN
ncbi:MAG: glycerophosphodiester phosphodiesterase [Clostridia bacterium]|nr:glycerophosphodiester phosphodiesterase [Clostridia bacterium]